MMLMTVILIQKKNAMWHSKVSQDTLEHLRFMKFEGGTQECEIEADDCFKKLIMTIKKNQDIYALETMMRKNNLKLRYI